MASFGESPQGQSNYRATPQRNDSTVHLHDQAVFSNTVLPNITSSPKKCLQMQKKCFEMPPPQTYLNQTLSNGVQQSISVRHAGDSKAWPRWRDMFYHHLDFCSMEPALSCRCTRLSLTLLPAHHHTPQLPLFTAMYLSSSWRIIAQDKSGSTTRKRDTHNGEQPFGTYKLEAQLLQKHEVNSMGKKMTEEQFCWSEGGRGPPWGPFPTLCLQGVLKVLTPPPSLGSGAAPGAHNTQKMTG